jgi:Tfp pilus assembly protein PilO
VKTKKRTMSPRTLSVLIALASLLVVVAGVYLLVLPQRHKADRLENQTEQTQQAIEEARLAAQPQHVQPIHVANLFKLVKAIPDTPDMPGIVLQLNQTARDAGIEFDSITLGALAPGATQVPIQLQFNGNFYDLEDFLFRLRNLVAVRDGALQATGRLFSVQSIAFTQGQNGFPSIGARLDLSAYVYASTPALGAAPAPAATSTDTTATDTTSTETTTTGTTTTAPDSSVVAAGTGAAG